MRSNGPAYSRLLVGLCSAAFVLLVGRPSSADEWPLPRSLPDAIRMERADALPITPFYSTSTLAGTKPGALLRQEDATGYATPKGARAVRILYHSLDADGKDVVTSGLVLIPAGAAPAGGWPVIAWAHGTTGVARMCAPSLQKDVAYGEEGLMPMVRAGFAVVATDYHGLGTEGAHQYLNKVAQGRDVIYSIAAAHAAVPALGKRWVVDGHSQGGMTAWSVAEMEATLRDPDYLGAVSVSGAADAAVTLGKMGDPSSTAAYYLLYVAFAIHERSPEFKPADMLVGEALKRYPDAIAKGCWNYLYASFLDVKNTKVVKDGWMELPAVKRYMQGGEFGTQPIGGPLLVITGEADETVPVEGVRVNVRKACRNGIDLSFRSYPGLDHDPTMDKSTPDQLAWIRDRFAGKPFHGNCQSL
jgi:pimeloyl-ACP methyl ester carboxylesterase